MKWRRKRTESLPPLASTDALIEELDEQLTKASVLVKALRERAKAVEGEEPQRRARPVRPA